MGKHPKHHLTPEEDSVMLLGFKAEQAKEPILFEGMRVVISSGWPSPAIVGNPTPISGLPARTKDSRFVVEGGHWMQIALPLIGLHYAAFAMGCLWEERHQGILTRFPVTAVWTPEQWEAANADPEFSLAEHLLAKTLKSYEQFLLRKNIEPDA